jgi:hypothetical protein
MRNRALHDALRDFALEAAALLVRATDAGAEIGFALDERSEGSATLYRYRPLTDEFIGERWVDLRMLPAFENAARTLGSGARSYLRRRGEPGADAEPALRMMLERLYEDATSFGFPEERFESVYASVERALYAGTIRATVVAPVIGLRLEGARVELGDELALADAALLSPSPDLAWGDLRERAEENHRPTTLLVLERDVPADASLPLAEARARFRAALLALRLLEPGGVALGPLAFARTGEGEWEPLRLGPSGHARGAERSLPTEAGHELRQLLQALESGSGEGPVAWALPRFEMGLERDQEVEALSDYLLALRALLDSGRASDPATVALRLAALCAEEDQRRAVQRRIEAAFGLEPFVIERGLGAASGTHGLDEAGFDGWTGLVRELEEALRQLLGGVVCGELDSDLQARADEILLRSGAPVEVRARRLGDEGDDAVDGDPLSVPARLRPEDDPGPGPWAEPVTSEPEAGAARMARREWPDPGSNISADPLRAACLDWELDEESASYSAPV